MELHRRPDRRLLRLSDDGSAVIEGVAAITIGFLLLAVVVQVSLALVARASAQGIVDAAARHAARPGVDVADVATQVVTRIGAGVPNASGVAATVTAGGDDEVQVTARFDWTPPGPFLGSVGIAVGAAAPRLVPP